MIYVIEEIKLWLDCESKSLNRNVIMQVRLSTAFTFHQLIGLISVHWFLVHLSHNFNEDEGKIAFSGRKIIFFLTQRS